MCLGTDVIGDTVSQSGSREFMAWFVAVLMSFDPIHNDLEGKLFNDLEDPL